MCDCKCNCKLLISHTWVILKTPMLQGELTSASAILDFLASPETLDLPGQVSNQNLSLAGKSDILSKISL